jgi:hypothetical protein
MNPADLLEKIRTGHVTGDLLPPIFDDENEIPEELRLKAVAHVMRLNPAGAGTFFQRLQPQRLAEAVEQNRMEPALITLAVRAFATDKRLCEAALRSPRTPTQALLMLAEKADETAIGLLTRDELRLILAPELLAALLRRANLDELLRQKLEILQQRIKRDAQLQIRAAFRPENLTSEDRELFMQESSEAETNPRESIYVKLMNMTAAERAMLALTANRMTRMLLIRDPNTLVSRAVMRSPRLAEQDIEVIARMKEVDEEILRMISLNRRWMRKYTIMKSLVMNPRTPTAIALGLIDRMSNSDIKAGTRDHNVPSAVKQAIRRVAEKRGLL